MPRWPKDTVEFTVSILSNKKRGTYVMHVPKPILKKMGNPARLTYLVREDEVVLRRSDAHDQNAAPSASKSARL